MNNKGFTLVEILAVIVIISIIAVISVLAYSKYLESSRQKAYDTMAKSAANAAAEYAMDHLGTETVTLKELTDEEYLEFPTDPSHKGGACTGKVEIKENVDALKNPDGLDTENYDVTICCSSYSYLYHFPGGTKELTTCE